MWKNIHSKGYKLGLIYKVLRTRCINSVQDQGLLSKDDAKLLYPYMKGYVQYLQNLQLNPREFFIFNNTANRLSCNVKANNGFYIARLTHELFGYMGALGVEWKELQEDISNLPGVITNAEALVLDNVGLEWLGHVVPGDKTDVSVVMQELADAEGKFGYDADAHVSVVRSVLSVSDRDLMGEIAMVRMMGRTVDAASIRYRMGPSKGAVIEISDRCKNVIWAYKAMLRDNKIGVEGNILALDKTDSHVEKYSRAPEWDAWVPVVNERFLKWLGTWYEEDIVQALVEKIWTFGELERSHVLLRIEIAELYKRGLKWDAAVIMEQDEYEKYKEIGLWRG